jgi:hypothetical protein
MNFLAVFNEIMRCFFDFNTRGQVSTCVSFGGFEGVGKPFLVGFYPVFVVVSKMGGICKVNNVF